MYTRCSAAFPMATHTLAGCEAASPHSALSLAVPLRPPARGSVAGTAQMCQRLLAVAVSAQTGRLGKSLSDEASEGW